MNTDGGRNMQNNSTMQPPNSNGSSFSGNSKSDESTANQNGNQSFGNNSQGLSRLALKTAFPMAEAHLQQATTALETADLAVAEEKA